MKFITQIVLVLSAVVLLAGCSSSSNDNKSGGGKGGNLNAAGLAMVGEWISDCSQDQQSGAFFREYLNLKNDGTGVFSYLIFQDGTCSGNAQQANPQNFTFSADPVNQGSSKVTVTFQGQQPATISVVVQGNRMTLTTAQGTVAYQKTQMAP